MSGVRVVRYLLANAAGVTAVVPAARIMAGQLPINTALPAITISQISSVPLRMIKRGAGEMQIDRVQVTVYRKAPPADTGYPGLKSLHDLILTALDSQRATIDTIKVDSILHDIEGPDFEDARLGFYARSRDYFVRWTV